MICFRVAVNGGRTCVAGVGEHGVLTVIVGWVSVPEEERIEPSKEWRAGHVRLDVSGLRQGAPSVHLNWLPNGVTLSPGDRVTIDVVDQGAADAPREHEDGYDPEVARRNRYEMYKLSAREFGPLTDADLPAPPDTADSKELRRSLYEQYRREFEP